MNISTIGMTIMLSLKAKVLNNPPKWLSYPTMGLNIPPKRVNYSRSGLNIPPKKLNVQVTFPHTTLMYFQLMDYR